MRFVKIFQIFASSHYNEPLSDNRAYFQKEGSPSVSGAPNDEEYPSLWPRCPMVSCEPSFTTCPPTLGFSGVDDFHQPACFLAVLGLPPVFERVRFVAAGGRYVGKYHSGSLVECARC